MPSPFPGMDPYLESPEFFSDFHHRLIADISADLNEKLPPGYVARMEERVYLNVADEDEAPSHPVRPDVAVRTRPASPGETPKEASTTVLCDPALWIDEAPEEERELYIEIVTVGRQRRVVAVIEVLSPANKTPSHPAHRQYRAKQRPLLRSQAHLLEIDLLRGGAHTVAPPIENLNWHGHWDYIVSLHRGGRTGFQVWPLTLRHRLPRVPVPLEGDLPDIVLDLQAVFARSYDLSDFERDIDYTGEPVPPLNRRDAEWADELLKEKGKR